MPSEEDFLIDAIYKYTKDKATYGKGWLRIHCYKGLGCTDREKERREVISIHMRVCM